jgi:hypothetical protein
MRRVTSVGWVILGALVGAVVVWPLSEAASLALGFVGGAVAFGAISQMLGDDWDPRDLSSRKSAALRRLSPGRDWDRKAPDFADEPADAIWRRERERRGLG